MTRYGGAPRRKGCMWVVRHSRTQAWLLRWYISRGLSAFTKGKEEVEVWTEGLSVKIVEVLEETGKCSKL